MMQVTIEEAKELNLEIKFLLLREILSEDIIEMHVCCR